MAAILSSYSSRVIKPLAKRFLNRLIHASIGLYSFVYRVQFLSTLDRDVTQTCLYTVYNICLTGYNLSAVLTENITQT